jgi:heme/copper-type cytochrome/quinol oxidase subunit 2
MTDLLMWIIIGGVVVLILLGVFIFNLVKYIKASKERWNSYDEEDASLGMTMSSIFGVFVLVLTIVGICHYPEYQTPSSTHIVDIMSISRGSSVEGHFALGSGTIQEESYYFYYYETEKGIKLGKVPADNTYIIETDEFVPSIYEIKEANTFFTYNNLYVPVGTVMTVYSLS